MEAYETTQMKHKTNRDFVTSTLVKDSKNENN